MQMDIRSKKMVTFIGHLLFASHLCYAFLKDYSVSFFQTSMKEVKKPSLRRDQS
jgi:hypothetical protein